MAGVTIGFLMPSVFHLIDELPLNTPHVPTTIVGILFMLHSDKNIEARIYCNAICSLVAERIFLEYMDSSPFQERCQETNHMSSSYSFLNFQEQYPNQQDLHEGEAARCAEGAYQEENQLQQDPYQGIYGLSEIYQVHQLPPEVKQVISSPQFSEEPTWLTSQLLPENRQNKYLEPGNMTFSSQFSEQQIQVYLKTQELSLEIANLISQLRDVKAQLRDEEKEKKLHVVFAKAGEKDAMEFERLSIKELIKIGFEEVEKDPDNMKCVHTGIESSSWPTALTVERSSLSVIDVPVEKWGLSALERLLLGINNYDTILTFILSINSRPDSSVVQLYDNVVGRYIRKHGGVAIGIVVDPAMDRFAASAFKAAEAEELRMLSSCQ
ncbi:20291_t:CDS:10, partial [Cetraspora pellucida]